MSRTLEIYWKPENEQRRRQRRRPRHATTSATKLRYPNKWQSCIMFLSVRALYICYKSPGNISCRLVNVSGVWFHLIPFLLYCRHPTASHICCALHSPATLKWLDNMDWCSTCVCACICFHVLAPRTVEYTTRSLQSCRIFLSFFFVGSRHTRMGISHICHRNDGSPLNMWWCTFILFSIAMRNGLFVFEPTHSHTHRMAEHNNAVLFRWDFVKWFIYHNFLSLFSFLTNIYFSKVATECVRALGCVCVFVCDIILSFRWWQYLFGRKSISQQQRESVDQKQFNKKKNGIECPQSMVLIKTMRFILQINGFSNKK